jgi:hypothetical protein
MAKSVTIRIFCASIPAGFSEAQSVRGSNLLLAANQAKNFIYFAIGKYPSATL